jgi:hypothetical protein
MVETIRNSMKEVLLDTENVIGELEDGILKFTWITSFIDLDIAEKSVSKRVNAMDGKSYPLLIKMKSINNITKEARDFLASPRGCEGVIVAAIQVSSPLENMIASMFLYLNPPLVPTKIFKDETKAKEWLSHYLN